MIFRPRIARYVDHVLHESRAGGESIPLQLGIHAVFKVLLRLKLVALTLIFQRVIIAYIAKKVNGGGVNIAEQENMVELD